MNSAVESFDFFVKFCINNNDISKWNMGIHYLLLFEGNQEVIKYILDIGLSKQTFSSRRNFGHGEFLSNERERFGLRK